MGRYLTGFFDWKFAFGDQGSTFGIVIEEITNNCENVELRRYTSEYGEKLEMYIVNKKGLKELKEECKRFIGKGFKPYKTNSKKMKEWGHCNEKFGNEYWDKVMIKKFMGKLDNTIIEETIEFDVEY